MKLFGPVHRTKEVTEGPRDGAVLRESMTLSFRLGDEATALNANETGAINMLYAANTETKFAAY